MAGFLTKEEVASEAARLGLDLTGMTWPQKQKAVIEAQKSNPPERKASDKDAEIAELKRQLAKAKEEAKAVPQVPVVFDEGINFVEPTIQDYDDAVLIASPEQKPTSFQRGKYYEKVGKEKITRERSFEIGRTFHDGESGLKMADYDVEETGRDVTATSTMPKYSCMLTYRPTKDLCATAEFQGHKGYLWTHHRLPNIKHMLKQMGVYEEYSGLWRERKKMFYLGGLVCCDIDFTNEMFQRIQRELRRRAKAGEDAVL